MQYCSSQGDEICRTLEIEANLVEAETKYKTANKEITFRLQ